MRNKCFSTKVELTTFPNFIAAKRVVTSKLMIYGSCLLLCDGNFVYGFKGAKWVLKETRVKRWASYYETSSKKIKKAGIRSVSST